MRGGIDVFIAILFGLSAFEKFQQVFSGSAAWHPVLLLRPRLREHATAVFVISAALDVVTAVGMLFAPQITGVLCIALLATYSAVTIASSETKARPKACRCFGRFFEAPGRSYVAIRNLALTVLVAGAAWVLHGSVAITATSLSVAMTLVVILALSSQMIRKKAVARQLPAMPTQGGQLDAV